MNWSLDQGVTSQGDEQRRAIDGWANNHQDRPSWKHKRVGVSLAILAVAGVDCVVELAVAQLGHLGGQGGVGVGLRLQRGVDLGIVGVSFARFVP